jgi:MATE family multidrug resistance protein
MAPGPSPSPTPGSVVTATLGVVPVLVVLVGLGAVWAGAALGVLPPDLALVLSGLGIAVSVVAGLRRGWLHAPSSSRLVRLGVPVILAMVSQTAVNVVDTAFVGRLPPEVALPGVAAIGISLPVFWLVGGFLSAIAIGTQAIVARRAGQSDEADAGSTLVSAAAMATVLGIAFSALGYLVLPDVLPFFNSDPAVVEQGLAFARIRYLGISSMVITAAYKAFFDGTGRTHVHMGAAFAMNVVNLVLCYGLIFGELGMPRMEVAGAAWASTISSAIGTLWMIAYTFKPSILRPYRLYAKGSFSWAKIKQITALSLPSGGATVIGMLGFLLFHKAVAAVDAAHPSGLPINASATAVIQQIVMLVFLVSFAFGTATATLVSQSMGADDPDAAARYTWESVKLGTLIMAAISSVLFIYPEAALAAFIKSNALGEAGKAAAIDAGVGPLRIIAAASTLISAAVVFTQSLYGAGNTKFVMVVEGILHIGCLVPLSWALGVALGGGLTGIWCAAAVYILLLAVIMGHKFAGGSWKTIRL